MYVVVGAGAIGRTGDDDQSFVAEPGVAGILDHLSGRGAAGVWRLSFPEELPAGL